MSKKKSLGSSPIGYSSIGVSSFQFIPDTEVSATDSSSTTQGYNYVHSGDNTEYDEKPVNSQRDKAPEKKITSYYLEVEVVERLKVMADDSGTYYSSLVNEAIQHWVDIHGY